MNKPITDSKNKKPNKPNIKVPISKISSAVRVGRFATSQKINAHKISATVILILNIF